MAKAMLQLNNVTRNFKQGGEKVTALRKTNFTVNAGEFIAVIGPSGSGKSTFLTIAGGLQNPSSGQVIINDIDGIISPEVERTIRNLGSFCNEGMKNADNEIINIMVTH